MRFIVEGKPQGKERPRFARGGRVYTPAKTVAYEEKIRDAYLDSDGLFVNGAVRIVIKCIYKMPGSESKWMKQKMLLGYIKPVTKPDLDNVAKVVCDALIGIAYPDDSYIVELIVEKHYGVHPRLEVAIESVS